MGTLKKEMKKKDLAFYYYFDTQQMPKPVKGV